MKEYGVFSITYDGYADCEEFTSKSKAMACANRKAKDVNVDVVYIQVGNGEETINIKL
jgi:hypothetical protein